MMSEKEQESLTAAQAARILLGRPKDAPPHPIATLTDEERANLSPTQAARLLLGRPMDGPPHPISTLTDEERVNLSSAEAARLLLGDKEVDGTKNKTLPDAFMVEQEKLRRENLRRMQEVPPHSLLA